MASTGAGAGAGDATALLGALHAWLVALSLTNADTDTQAGGDHGGGDDDDDGERTAREEDEEGQQRGGAIEVLERPAELIGVLCALLVSIDEEHFVAATSAASKVAASTSLSSRGAGTGTDNWVLRFNALKRVYARLIRYFEDVLACGTSLLPVPHLETIARGPSQNNDNNNSNGDGIGGGAAYARESSQLLALALALAVQSEHKEHFIAPIQRLSQVHQAQLMISIEQTMALIERKAAAVGTPLSTPGMGARRRSSSSTFSSLRSRRAAGSSGDRGVGDAAAAAGQGGEMDDEDEDDGDDDGFYERSFQRAAVRNASGAYESLMRAHESLKLEHDDALARLAQAERAIEEGERKKVNSKDEAVEMLREQYERVRTELQRTSNELGEAEQANERHSRAIEDLTRKIEDLAPKAAEADKLKDQVDELRHASERAHKAENVLEKYKRKLEDSADLRRSLKSLEDQNADLIDKVAVLEGDLAKSGTYKARVDSLRSDLDRAERRAAEVRRENESLRLDVTRARDEARAKRDEAGKHRETVSILEDRMRELELAGGGGSPNKSRRAQGAAAAADDSLVAGGGELDDALHEQPTRAELRVQIRRLERELLAIRAGDGGAGEGSGERVAELERALEDAERAKQRLAREVLDEHKAKLVAERKLDDILAAKGYRKDSPEVVMALQTRLNETTDELDLLRKQQAALAVEHEAQSKALTLARSDLNLVDKDHLDAVRSLRASVSEDKNALARELDSVRDRLQEAEGKTQTQLAQINELLLDKVAMQNESLNQRERLSARERDFSDLQASLAAAKEAASSSQSEADAAEQRSQLSKLEHEVAKLHEDRRRMRQFIQEQEEAFKETSTARLEREDQFEEAEAKYQADIKSLQGHLDEARAEARSIEARYRQQYQQLLATASRSVPSVQGDVSWLARQRARTEGRSGVRRS